MKNFDDLIVISSYNSRLAINKLCLIMRIVKQIIFNFDRF